MGTLYIRYFVIGAIAGAGLMIFLFYRWKQKKVCPTVWPITLSFSNFKIKGGISMVEMKRKQSFTATLGKPVDINGDEAEIESGTLKITSANPDVVTVEPDPAQPDNPFGFKAKSKGFGVTQIDFEGDADLGEGVKPIKGFLAVEVKSGEAVGFKDPVIGPIVDEPDETV